MSSFVPAGLEGVDEGDRQKCDEEKAGSPHDAKVSFEVRNGRRISLFLVDIGVDLFSRLGGWSVSHARVPR